MLKRKYADRRIWQRIIDRDYTQTYIDTSDFTGYITLLKMNKVKEELSFTYEGEKICVVDDGYSWLQHFPTNQHYSVTTSFNQHGIPVQYYVDICEKISTEDGVPFLDDLFIDMVYLPSGKIVTLDEDELEEAHKTNQINSELYHLALRETKSILYQIKQGKLAAINQAKQHKVLLEESIK